MLMSLQNPEQALLHLQKAVALTQKRGFLAFASSRNFSQYCGTEKSVPEFQRRHEKTLEPERRREQTQPSEVTKQALDLSVEP